MCNSNGCYGYCDPQEMTDDEQDAFLKEREAILEAKLVTVRHLRESLKGKKKSDKSE